MVDGQSLTNIIRARLLESLELILFLARQLFLSWVDLLGHVIPVVKVRRVQGVLELGCPWGLVALLNEAVPLHLVEPRMPLLLQFGGGVPSFLTADKTLARNFLSVILWN